MTLTLSIEPTQLASGVNVKGSVVVAVRRIVYAVNASAVCPIAAAGAPPILIVSVPEVDVTIVATTW